MSKDANKSEPSMDDILASIRRIIDEDGTKTRKPGPMPGGKAPADILELTELVNEDGSVTSLQNPGDAAPDLTPRPLEDDEPPIYADRGDRERPIGNASPEPSRPVLAGDPQPAGRGSQSTDDVPTQIVPPRPQPQPGPAAPAASAQPAPPRIMPSTNSGGISLTPVNTTPQQPPQTPSHAPAPQSGLVSGQTANAAAAAFDRLAQAALQQQPSAPPVPKAPSPTVGGRALEDMVSEMLRPMLQQWLDSNLPAIVERLVQQEIQKIRR